MARVFHVGALNIIMHPHTAESYVEILQQAKQRQIICNYHADRFAMISSFLPYDPEEPLNGYTGQITSFLNIDPNDPWLSITSGKAAVPSELSEINIPEHLKPGMRRFNFVFFPKNHRLIFETKGIEGGHSFGHKSAKNAFYRILNDPSLLKKYGEITVNIEPQSDALEKVLSVDRIRTLTIHINRPNADDKAVSMTKRNT